MSYVRLTIFASLVVTCLACFGCGSDQSSPAVAQAAPQENSAAKRAKSHDKNHTNRLANETSPYLLLHAHNPVDWYPWGPEALAKAKKENKLIFLSIGYSSCHWCHVMERESFLDDEIAALLNEHFVCIKVDREERPDVDSIYMTSLHVYYRLIQAGRGGGWPLSMFLTPDGKPFFGGTYFPARDGDRGVATGFLTIVKRIHEYFETNPETINRDAETVTQLTKAELEGTFSVSLVPINKQLGERTFDALSQRYDSQYGGFNYDPMNPLRPKFPEPSNLLFLVEWIKETDDATARDMLVATLEKMSLGGIYDHLGGGFHRYSVDRYWRIPHFEKMLYDNGQLATIYTEAHLLTGREDFRRVVIEMLDFVLREMTDQQGGFYSALDAESEGEEGKFYRWERDEVKDLLTAEQYELFAPIYGLSGAPNFEEGYYALQLDTPLGELAAERKTTAAALVDQLAPIRQKLLDARNQRERPLTDTKILTSWNGLMIRGMADAGRGLKIDRFTEAAETAARFVLTNLRADDGRLWRTYGQGQAKLNAYLNDYAFLADGLIALHQATGDAEWLRAAEQITEKQIELFWDEKRGGFYFTSDDHEELLARAKSPLDGAQPAGNSVSAQNLVYLAAQLDKPDYLTKADKTIQSALVLLQRAPTSATRMSAAVIEYLRQSGDQESPPAAESAADSAADETPETKADPSDPPK